MLQYQATRLPCVLLVLAGLLLPSTASAQDLTLSASSMGEDQVMDQAGTIVNSGDLAAFPEAPNYTTSSDVVTAGRRLRYTLTATNNGGAPAEDVELTVNLPSGTTHLPGTLSLSAPGSCQLGTPGDAALPMTCSLDDIAVANDISATFDVLVSPFQAPGSVLVLDAEVSAASDLDPTDNLASSQVVVNTWADTEITLLSVGDTVTDWDDALRRHMLETLPGQVTPGLGLRFQATVQNRGPSAAANVQILGLIAGQQNTGLDHDPIQMTDLGTTCLDGSYLQEIGVFGPEPGQGQFGQVVWCNLGIVAPGARTAIEWLATADPSVPDNTELSSGAYVWWGDSSPPAPPGGFLGFPFPQIPPELPTTDDPFLEDNFSDIDTDTSAVADLSIETTISAKSVTAGQSFDLSVTVLNHGPSAARDVDFSIDYPLDEGTPAISFIDVVQVRPLPSEVNPACVEGATALDCSFFPDDLSPGDDFTVEIGLEVRADIFEDPVLDIDSQAATTDTDFHLGNNVDSSALYVNGLAGDFFTELFPEGTQDLDGFALRLSPDAGPSGYSVCLESPQNLVSPNGSETYLVLGDDDASAVNLTGGKEVRFYGEKHSTVWVGSNGYVTFGTGDIEYRPTLANHFSHARIAAFFADLDPSLGGDVWWMQLDDRLVVSFDAVPHVDPMFGDQTFQLQMFFNGRIVVSYGTLTGAESLAGLSTGDGIPDPFLGSDLNTDYLACPEIFMDGFESGDTTAWAP